MENNKEIIDNNATEETVFVPRRRRETKNKDMIFKLRNILNIIFIIGGVVGMIYYFFVDELIGTYIVLGAMAFKFTEATIRLLKI